MLSHFKPRNRAERRRLSHSPGRSQHTTTLRPRFIRITAACAYAGVGRSKFYDDFLSRLRTLRVGRLHLIELDSLDELLDQLASEQETERAAV
jgi:hypothetical protein